jgi:hypothetical protein
MASLFVRLAKGWWLFLWVSIATVFVAVIACTYGQWRLAFWILLAGWIFDKISFVLWRVDRARTRSGRARYSNGRQS